MKNERHFNESEADDFFRADAERLGYLAGACCAVEPENHDLTDHAYRPAGRGLRAYYRDHGMIQPEVLEREIPETEVNGLDWSLPLDGLR